MYVATVPNRGAKPTILLREGYRENGKVKNRTIANLTRLPPNAIEILRRILRGESVATVDEAIEVVSSRSHGQVEAVLGTMRKLGFEGLIAGRRCRERDLVLGMIASRVFAPSSKLATTRTWQTTTLPEQMHIEDATEDDLYAAMDWLVDRQPVIEKKLAARHLEPCGLVLYDLTSTWVEGNCCPLAAFGHSRDGKKDKQQVNFGLLTDEEGRPVSVTVYEGNVGDPATVKEQVAKLKERFGLDLVVLVGDRGMVTQTQIDAFIEQDGVEWITALKSGAIRKLRAEGSLQLGLFDERNLFELQSPAYPGERLIACRNPELAVHRAKKREELIAATRAEVEKVQRMVQQGRLHDRAEIGLRVGKVINKYKVAKHFKLEIGDGVLRYRVRHDKVQAEAALDGIYVIRTSVPKELMSPEDTVRHYKRLTRVERAFRSMKTVSLKVRPIFHWSERRVRAHIFLCMLAYYVEWHMRRAWSSLLFAEEEDTTMTRDPVAAAKPSTTARQKASTKKTLDGLPVHSFSSLLDHLSSIVQNRCRRKGAPKNEPRFTMLTRPDKLQRRAIELLAAM
jgi:hypothetical protein